MINGMTMSKIAISLPTRLVEQAKRAVREGRASSVSAYVVGALEARVLDDDLSALLDEMLRTSGGPLTNAERATADLSLNR